LEGMGLPWTGAGLVTVARFARPDLPHWSEPRFALRCKDREGASR